MQSLVSSFLEFLFVERGCSKNTVLAYRRDIAKLLFFLEDKGITSFKDVTYDHFHELLKQFKDIGLDANSVRRSLAAYKSLFRFLCKEEIVPKNIPFYISPPRTWQRIPSYLTYEEVVKLIEKPNVNIRSGLVQRAILETLYGTGVRISELCNLNVHDIDFEQRIVFVRNGKGGKDRLVPITKISLEYIEMYWNKKRQKEKLKRDDPAFASKFGNRLDRFQIFVFIQRFARLCKFKKRVSPHTLRHTYATHLYQNGADLRTIQELLGHSSINSTNIYIHIGSMQLRHNFHQFHPREIAGRDFF